MDIVLRAFLETFIKSTKVSRRLQGEVSQSVFAKNYIATGHDQVGFVIVQFSLINFWWMGVS